MKEQAISNQNQTRGLDGGRHLGKVKGLQIGSNLASVAAGAGIVTAGFPTSPVAESTPNQLFIPAALNETQAVESLSKNPTFESTPRQLFIPAVLNKAEAPVEDLSENPVAVKAVDMFVTAFANEGVTGNTADILQNGLNIRQVKDSNGNTVDIAAVTIEGFSFGGEFPLLVKTETGWERATMGNIAQIAGTNVGTALSSPNRVYDYGEVEAKRLDKLVASEYNTANIEAVGWVWTEYEYNKFNWPRTDEAIALAKQNGMKVQGDTLVSGPSNQKWTFLKGEFNYNGEMVDVRKLHATDPERAKQILTDVMVNHITAIVSRYEGQVDQWSVVTGVGESEGDDIFMDIIGPEYINIAFRAAREADPKAKLILTENKIITVKDQKYKMVKGIVDSLKAEGLIDAIGVVMHIDVAWQPSEEELIEGFKSWGIPVMVSALDLNVADMGGSPEFKLINQGEFGAKVYRALEESGVGIGYSLSDGFGDKFSWLENPNEGNNPDADPTPFFDNGDPKPWVYQLLREMMNGLR